MKRGGEEMVRKKVWMIGMLILGISMATSDGIKIEDLLLDISKAYKVFQGNLQNEGFTVKEKLIVKGTGTKEEETEENKISFFQGKWKTETIPFSEKIKPAKDKKTSQAYQDAYKGYSEGIGEEGEEKSQYEIPDAFEHLNELYHIFESKDYKIDYIKEESMGSYSSYLFYFEPKKIKGEYLGEGLKKGYVWIEKDSLSIIQAKFSPFKLPPFTKKCEYSLSCSPYQRYWLPEKFVSQINVKPFFFKEEITAICNFYDYTFGGFK